MIATTRHPIIGKCSSKPVGARELMMFLLNPFATSASAKHQLSFIHALGLFYFNYIIFFIIIIIIHWYLITYPNYD
jgi:hypothetical protein